MNDFFIDQAIAIILRVIKQCKKNTLDKAEWKKPLLKIRDAINILYPTEE